MDLSGAKIKPADGFLAVRFIDDDDDDDEDDKVASSYSAQPSEPVPYEGLLATVVAVGAKVNGIKPGNIVVTRPYARDGLEIGDGIRLIESYCVAATISA